MPISQAAMEALDESVGSGVVDAGASGGDAPNGRNMVGALNEIKRIGEEMDDYGISDPSNLPQAKFDALQEAQEDLQYHVSQLSNVMVNDFVGQDDGIELPNGNTIGLPNAATSGSNSANVPDAPSGGN